MTSESPNPDIVLLNVKQVAKALGVTPMSVYNWTKSGVLPQPIKLGVCTRWRAKEIDAFLEKQRVEWI